jgi:hypothetical protein
MPRHLQRSIEHRFRCAVWFVFFIVCIAAFFFPPWIITSEQNCPALLSLEWLKHVEFHFLTYQPPDAVWYAYTTTGCVPWSFSNYKHLNYYWIGIEIVCFGILAQFLRLVIRRHPSPKTYIIFLNKLASSFHKKQKSEQVVPPNGP